MHTPNTNNERLPKELTLRALNAWLGPWDLMYRAAPPTDKSVSRIESALHVKLPPLLVEVATACSNYGAWFGSIGEDFNSGTHILSINRAFSEEGLSANFVLFNHGHDGECDGWEIDSVRTDGESPVVWLTLSDFQAKVLQRSVVARSFAEYLDILVHNHAGKQIEEYVAKPFASG